MREIPFGRPIIGEEEKKAVTEVLNGPILVHGPRAKEFEAAFSQFVKAPYALSTSSCTAALHLSYFYLGIGEGDEVIVPSQTHTATVHPVELCRAKPVFVDAERDTGNIDIDQIEPLISERTKAISLVHFLGMPVNMDKVMNIAKKHRLFVVEDCALALGTYFKGIHAGLHGDVGCFSFYPIKHITTTEGGMLVTRRREVAEKVSLQKALGVDRQMGERKIPGMYDVKTLGFNYRLSEVGAALGLEQLKRLDGFLKRRRENYEALSKGLREIDEIGQFQSTHGDYQSSYYCFAMLLNKRLTAKRLEIIKYLNEKGVGTSIYYPRPVPHFTYYKNKYRYSDNTFPVATWISNASITLPVGPHLVLDDMDYIVKAVKDVVKKVR